MKQSKGIRETTFYPNAFYHSGFKVDDVSVQNVAEESPAPSATTADSTRVIFSTSKYPSPLNVGITTSADWGRIQPMVWNADGHWYIDLDGPPFGGSFEFKIRLGSIWMAGGNRQVAAGTDTVRLSDRDVYLLHTVKVLTDHWRPNHRITLRSPVDGWHREVYGRFHTPESGPGTWTFVLDRARFRESILETSFVLDRQHWLNTDNMEIDIDEHETVLTDEDVDFDISPSAFVHGYDNLVAEESLWEHRIVPPSARPDPQKTYDVIVVGSGMAGGTLADALSDLGLETLVLEAGGLGYPIHMNGLPRGEENPVGRDELQSHHTRDSGFVGGLVFNLGGRSNYWSGIIPQMQPWEFGNDVWPKAIQNYLLGTNGQASGYEAANDLLKKQISMGPYQDKVMALLQKQLGKAYQVDILPRSMHQPHLTDEGELQNVVRRSNGAFSTSDLLLDSLGFKSNAGERYLDLALHHLTTRVEPADGHVLAHCQDLVGNQERTYKGRHIVFCCGCVESPRLAMQSGLADPNAKMGIGLTDHAAYTYRHTPTLPNSGPLAWLGDADGHAKMMVRLKDQNNNPFNLEVLINGAYWDVRHADPELWERVRPKEATVGMKFIFDSPLDDSNFIEPRGEGRKPLIHVKHNMHGEPHKKKMVQVRNSILTALGIPSDELSKKWHDDEWWVGNHGSVQHSGGSMRMSDQGTGVVDENLKLLAYDNIHCCDPSVFPSIPAANPSLTIAALALRLAHHLKNILTN